MSVVRRIGIDQAERVRRQDLINIAVEVFDQGLHRNTREEEFLYYVTEEASPDSLTEDQVYWLEEITKAYANHELF